MNISKKGISTTAVAVTIVLIVVIVAAAAYIAVSPGKTNTVTQTTTKTNTVTSLSTSTSTSISTSVTTATSASPTYYPLTLQAGGSTFVNPVMQVWAQSFKQFTNGIVQTNYQSVGSGSGITGIEQGTFMFAGSDAPLTTSQWEPYSATAGLNGSLLQIPETLGGVAIFYNLPGVTAHLNFTGPIIADIYVGKITMWNDPAITTLNPSITFPAQPITPVHRSDGSGTTYALANYLEKTSADWNASFTGGCPCYGTSLPSTVWGGNANNQGAKGSSAVASYVLGNQYSIGYADSVYATNAGLLSAAIKNQAGAFLTPTVTDIAAAANAFSAQVLANPTFTITNAPGAGSYPISTFTYILVWANQKNQQQGYDMAQFFNWIVNLNQGQALGPSLNYPALPTSVIAIDQSLIQQMNYNGVSFIPA